MRETRGVGGFFCMGRRVEFTPTYGLVAKNRWFGGSWAWGRGVAPRPYNCEEPKAGTPSVVAASARVLVQRFDPFICWAHMAGAGGRRRAVRCGVDRRRAPVRNSLLLTW